MAVLLFSKMQVRYEDGVHETFVAVTGAPPPTFKASKVALYRLPPLNHSVYHEPCNQDACDSAMPAHSDDHSHDIAYISMEPYRGDLEFTMEAFIHTISRKASRRGM